MRKLGLDLGSKSCGIAISDPLNITAQGLENLKFAENDFMVVFDRIAYYLSRFSVDIIVLGYPTLPSGDKSKTTIMIELFARELKKRFSQKVVFIDENGTTKRANELMIDAGLSRKKRKVHKDKIAAQIILEQYLLLNTPSL